MSNFDETLMKRLTKLEREVERLQVKESPIMSNYLTNFAWQSWTPTLTGWSSTTLVVCYYCKLGKIMFFSAIISGTSNSTSTSFTLPESNAGSEYTDAMGWCVDGGSALTAAGRYGIAQGSNICSAYTDMAAGAWTPSGTKRVSVYGWIAIN